jgi:hypothetical protein
MDSNFWFTLIFLISGCTLWLVWYSFDLRRRGGWNTLKDDLIEWSLPVIVIMSILILVVTILLLFGN